MTLTAIGSQFGKGGTGLTDGTLKTAIKELQGLAVTTVAGAANGTAMAVPALRTEDTLLAAICTVDAGGATTNDVANMTIQPTHASGTITISGNPVAAETFVVNGVTYTFVATPSLPTDVKITAGNNTAMALAAANTINAYENRRLPNGGGQNTAQVVATAALGVVTVTSVADEVGNGPVVTDTGSTITISSTNPAAVTATCVSAGNTDAITVNGVAFTIKTTPVDLDVDIAVLASDTLQAAEFVRAINAYENKHHTLDVVATSALGVVTIAPKSARKGNIITLTEAATNVAVTGSGWLAGGTATGGVKSTTNLTGKTVTLMWYNKQ